MTLEYQSASRRGSESSSKLAEAFAPPHDSFAPANYSSSPCDDRSSVVDGVFRASDASSQQDLPRLPVAAPELSDARLVHSARRLGPLRQSSGLLRQSSGLLRGSASYSEAVASLSRRPPIAFRRSIECCGGALRYCARRPLVPIDATGIAERRTVVPIEGTEIAGHRRCLSGVARSFRSKLPRSPAAADAFRASPGVTRARDFVSRLAKRDRNRSPEASANTPRPPSNPPTTPRVCPGVASGFPEAASDAPETSRSSPTTCDAPTMASAAGDSTCRDTAGRCETAHSRSDAFYDHFALFHPSSDRGYGHNDRFDGPAAALYHRFDLAADPIAEFYACVRPPN
jgi:hypothetical protein